MPGRKGKKGRGTEILTALLLILLLFSYIASFLLDFRFVGPDANLQEDLAFLSENPVNQRISSYSWLISSLLTGMTVPFYLIIFRKQPISISVLSALLMVASAICFLMMALVGLELFREMDVLLKKGVELAGGSEHLSLLDYYRKEQFYRHLGSTFIGIWSVGLGLSKFWYGRFPVTATLLLLVSGPTLVFFNWYDPEHLARTVAMTGIFTGIMLLCVRLVNKGLSKRT
jgi:hypothetical protein